MPTEARLVHVYINGKLKHVREHRRILARFFRKWGLRPLGSNIVHHRDRNPLNNDIGNLLAMPRCEHCRFHAARQRRKKGRFA